MGKLIDLTGQRFGKLTVLRMSEIIKVRGGTVPTWLTKCDCGKTAIVRGVHLRTGRTTSCGCEKGYTSHGMTGSREYQVWDHMLRRCFNQRCRSHRDYGGRGITVCDRWRKSFAAFYEDMGPRPSPQHSIDRIDNNGHYEPGNCRWATRVQQNRNTRRSRFVSSCGKKATVAEWAEITGIPAATIYHRLSSGWSHELAVTTPRQDKYAHTGR